MLWGRPPLTPEEPAHGRSLTGTWGHMGTGPCVTHPSFRSKAPLPGACLTQVDSGLVSLGGEHEPCARCLPTNLRAQSGVRVRRPRAPSREQLTRGAPHSHGTVFCLWWHLQRGF